MFTIQVATTSNSINKLFILKIIHFSYIMKLIIYRTSLIFSIAFVTVCFTCLLPACAQKDPNAKVIRELDSNEMRPSRLRGAKVYSNGDIELKDGTFIKRNGTKYRPDGSITKRNDHIEKEYKGRKILQGGISIDKNGTSEDMCNKFDECRNFRNANYIIKNGVWKPKK